MASMTRSLRSSRARARDPQPSACKTQVAGFTLVELMVTIAIASILLTLAAPSFKTTIERWRVNETRDTFRSSFYLARREAIKNNGNILLIRVDPDEEDTCSHVNSDNDWGCGWRVCEANTDQDDCESSASIVQTVPPPNKLHVDFKALDGTNIGYLLFNRWGQPQTAGTLQSTIYPVDANASSSNSRKLCISGGGRIQAIAAGNCA